MILILGEQITNIEGWAADRASELMRKHNGRKGRREEGNNGAGNFPPCPAAMPLPPRSLSLTSFPCAPPDAESKYE